MKRIMQKQLTIRNIAKEAGVSISVVSTILNGKENQKIFVGEKKKKEILELIGKYDYVPNKSARMLVSRRSNSIGIVFNSLTPYFSKLLLSIYNEAEKYGFEVTSYITNNSPEREKKHFNAMKDGRIDGVILSAFSKGGLERYREFASSKLKIVIIGPFIEGVHGISFEEKEAGRSAAEHLLKKGCKRLCFFGGQENLSDRKEGFIEKVQETGLFPFVFTDANFLDNFETDKKLAEKFLNTFPLPDGVFATNDLAGIALLTEALRKGIKIPEDLAIIGMDNTEICEYTYPSLTSIDLEIEQRARLAVRKLVKLIKNEPLEKLHTLVPFKLVERESTKKGEI
jgi:LacI family transcriptional regulator